MQASVGEFKMAKRRAAAMPAMWVQLPEKIDRNLFAKSSKTGRGAHFAPCSVGTGDANLGRKATGA